MFEKVVVKAGRGTLTYEFNQGSISSCFKENWIRRREAVNINGEFHIEAYMSGNDVFPSSPIELGKS